MQVKNILKVAGKSILKSRMRSLLTALGIIIGVAAGRTANKCPGLKPINYISGLY